MDEDYEKTFKKCNGMKAVREAVCDFEQPHRPASIVEEVPTVAASGTARAGVVVDAVEDAHRDGARDEDDEQLHPPTTSVEEVDTVVASETAGTDILFDVVEDAHHDEARDEDDEQPHDAIESLIYMCGMDPLDPDDPCFDIFQCDPSLDYDAHIESEFYTSKIQPTRVKICSHCAGKYDSPVELNTALKAPDGPYSIVLPICEECLAKGCRVVVRAARRNAQAKQAKMDAKAARDARRKGVDNIVDNAAPIPDVEQSASIEVDGTLAPSRAKNSRKRKAKATDNVGVTRATRSKASKNDRKSRNT